MVTIGHVVHRTTDIRRHKMRLVSATANCPQPWGSVVEQRTVCRHTAHGSTRAALPVVDALVCRRGAGMEQQGHHVATVERRRRERHPSERENRWKNIVPFAHVSL
jgi:hypothetical protein